MPRQRLPPRCPRKAWHAYKRTRRYRDRALERLCRRGWAEWTEQERAHNRARKRARYRMEQAGLAVRGDGNEVHHINGCPLDNRWNNLAVLSKDTHQAVTMSSSRKQQRRRCYRRD